MKTDHLGIWIRCWDGSEMEYEHWTHREITRMIKKGHANSFICKIMGSPYYVVLDKYLDDLRGGNLG